MDRYEYMKLSLEIILYEFIQQYKLQDLANKGFVYMETTKIVYGLTQAGRIDNDKLKLHHYKLGYESAPVTTGL